MTEGVDTARPARRFSAGLAACLLATVAVVMLAWPDHDAASIAIAYEFPDDRVIAAELEAVTRAGTTNVVGGDESYAIVREHLKKLSRTGDTRYLRYAKLALRYAGADRAASFDRMLLEARILQVEHNFSPAAELLRQAVAIRRDSAEAWLLLSDSLRRAGFPGDARDACLRLALAGESELAKWCGIQVLHSLGETQRAHAVQQHLMNSMQSLPAGSHAWALAVAADSAVYAGANDEAYQLYTQALSVGPSTLALRLAFADLLLATGRYDEVADTLSSDQGSTAALLRMVIANKQINGEMRTPAAATVEASLQMAAASNDPLSFRDRAIWELGFRDDANAAHDLALANWSTQKSFEDFLLLQSTAVAAGRAETLAMLEAWLANAASGSRS